MTVLTSTYYGLSRVREQSPDANDWAVTDNNFENLSKIMKALEQHRHTGVAAPNYPGFYDAPPAPTITTVGATGTESYSYYIVAKGAVNKISVTGILTPSTGNATLDTSNYNHLTWPNVTGATSYDIVRSVGGLTQGLIANVTPGTTTTSYDDQGAIADPSYTPAGQPDVVINDPTVTPGVLTPGTSLGIRMSYLDPAGLETQASPERIFPMPDEGLPPLAPVIPESGITTSVPGIAGGSYFYVMTKVKNSGETLISEVTPVSLAYNHLSSVTIQYDPLTAYTDGTTKYRIYRAAGYNESFQLVKTIDISDVSHATSYVDNGTVEDQSAQPPTTSTFGANQSINISWTNLTHPDNVVSLNIYVTQQSGIWTTNHLLHTEPIVSNITTNTSINYIGNESLDSGTPKESSQIPDGAPLIDIGADNLIPKVTTLPSAPADGAAVFYAPNSNVFRLQRYNFTANVWEIASGGPPLVTGLPASPLDGEEIYFEASNTVLHLRFSSSENVWWVVGGSPYLASDGAGGFLFDLSVSGTSGGTWSAAEGPSCFVPDAGRYVVSFGAQQMYVTDSSVTTSAPLGLRLVSSIGSILSLPLYTQVPGYTTTTDPAKVQSLSTEVVLTLSAATTLRLEMYTTSQAAGHGAWITATPVYLAP